MLKATFCIFLVKSLTCIGYGMTVDMDTNEATLSGYYNQGLLVVLEQFYDKVNHTSMAPGGDCSWELNSTNSNFTLNYTACDLKTINAVSLTLCNAAHNTLENSEFFLVVQDVGQSKVPLLTYDLTCRTYASSSLQL